MAPVSDTTDAQPVPGTPAVRLDARRTAVLGLHWQVNVVKPEGFFGPMLAEAVAVSGVIGRAAAFHDAARATGALVAYTRFTIPADEGDLVRNTMFMSAVGDAQESFRPDAPGAAVIAEMPVADADLVVDNQKLSGLAGNDLADRLRAAGVDTLLLTGVATNLVVEQTARHATDLGFTTYVVRDAVTAMTPAAHDAAIANLQLVCAGTLTTDEALASFG
jgi:nicotinamidase-related amidase